jgi:hypothetical protein
VGDNNYDSFVTKLGPNGTGLVYSTYVGGNYRLLAPAFGYGIAVDASGSAYVTGSISSADFPVTPGVIDSSSNGQSDVFVSKLDPSGGLSYSTYLGGINLETGYAIAVDSGGSAYVTGQTMSGDFPATAGAFDQTANGASDAFVAKLNATGTALDYATYIGGAEHESALGVSVDDAGSAYVAGFTNSVDWPTTAGAFDRTPNGSSDGFVAKLDASGTALSYSTYLGGSSTEEAYGIAVDSGGGAYVTGRTFSSDYPITGGAFDTSINGSADVFVTRLLADGAGLSFSTFVGGTDYEEGRAIALDTAGRPYVYRLPGKSWRVRCWRKRWSRRLRDKPECERCDVGLLDVSRGERLGRRVRHRCRFWWCCLRDGVGRFTQFSGDHWRVGSDL